MDRKHLEMSLTNWGLWAKDKYHKQHCASLEHHFRPPRGVEIEWETAAAPAPPFVLDILGAEGMQDVIGPLGFNYAWALTFKYCYPGFSRWKAAEFCGVYTPEKLHGLVKQARYLVAQATNHSESKAAYKYYTSTEHSVQMTHSGIDGQRQVRSFLKAA